MPNRIDIDFDDKGFNTLRDAGKTFLTLLSNYTRLTRHETGQDL